MLCPSRKIWICYLKVARSQQTFSRKMGIQYPPRPAGYFDSRLTPYRWAHPFWWPHPCCCYTWGYQRLESEAHSLPKGKRGILHHVVQKYAPPPHPSPVQPHVGLRTPRNLDILQISHLWWVRKVHTRVSFSAQAARLRYTSNKLSVMSQFEWY